MMAGSTLVVSLMTWPDLTKALRVFSSSLCVAASKVCEGKKDGKGFTGLLFGCVVLCCRNLYSADCVGVVIASGVFVSPSLLCCLLV